MPIAVITEEVVHVAGLPELKGKIKLELEPHIWEKLMLSIVC